MDLTLRFRVNSPRVAHEVIDAELVVIDFESGNYYSLESTGILIWGLIQKGASLGDMVDAILLRYPGEREEVRAAIGQFVEKLRAESLIVPEEEGDGRDGRDAIEWDPPNTTEKLEFDPPLLRKYEDMQELLLLDLIHEVDEAGWPSLQQDPLATRE